MSLYFPSTRTLCKGIQIRIEDLEVRFAPLLPMRIRGGLLRKVRRITPVSAVLVTLFFALHCTRPRPLPVRPEATAQPAVPGGGAVYTETGQASWYGGEDGFAGRQTASGEIYDPGQPTCAHRTLPFDTWIQVENLDTGQRAILRVNDRGPFAKGRILDISMRGAKSLGIMKSGTASVRIRTVDKAGLPAALDPMLSASNPYTVQVAALKDPANVERLSRELESEFGSVSFQEARDREGNSVKRVRVGSYASMEEAEKAAGQISKRFRDRGVEPFITRRR